jgi:hypothetical protein
MMTPRRWRSRVGMLLEGSTDGKYIKQTPDWSPVRGLGTDLTVEWRTDLSRQNGLGANESGHKFAPGQWKC